RGDGDDVGALAHAEDLDGLGGGDVVGVARVVEVERAGAGVLEGDHAARDRADARGAGVDGDDDGVTRGGRGRWGVAGAADDRVGGRARGDGDDVGALAHA